MFKKNIKNELLTIYLADENLASSELYDLTKEAILKKFDQSPFNEVDAIEALFSEFTINSNKITLRYDNWMGLFCSAQTIAANPIIEEIADYLEKEWKTSGLWERLGYK